MTTTYYIYGATKDTTNLKYKCPRCKKQGEFPSKYQKVYKALNLICPCGCGMVFRFKDNKAVI